MSSKVIELYGGSIEVQYPETFFDVSNIREIPDHQEVYLDSQGFSSIIVEILDRVNQSDAEALQHHLNDLVTSDAQQTKIISQADAHLVKLPQGTPAYSITAIAPTEKERLGRENEPEFTAIYLTLIRLEQKNTDLLVVINVPFINGQYESASVNLDAGQLGSLGQSATSARDMILQTFDIKDWSLFIDEV